MSDLAFQVLGPVTILRDGMTVALDGPKPLTVLTGLLLSANRTVPVATMIDWVWEEEDLPAHPRAALHNVVARLRRLLGPDVVQTRAAGYHLRADPERLDLLTFENRVDAAAVLAGQGRPEEAASHLAAALALCREPLLGNIESPALRRSETGRLTELYLSTHEKHAELCLRLGRHADVIKHLASLMDNHPFREPLVGQLMLALHHVGRRADALAAYERLRRVLRRELGVDPSPDLQQLHLRLLRTGTSQQEPAPRSHGLVAGTWPAVDRTHRAADLSEPDGPGGSDDRLQVCYVRSMMTVATRELRNDTAGVLRRVEAGEQIVITVNGKPVAQLVPLTADRGRWIPRAELARWLRTAQADPGLSRDLTRLAGDTTDDLPPIR